MASRRKPKSPTGTAPYRVLVTGGCGFIGSNLVRHLLSHRKGWEVVNLDRLTYAGNPENLVDVQRDPRYRFVRGDVAETKDVHQAMAGCSAVFHLAAESHVDRSIEGSLPFLRTNVTGTGVLLEEARRVGVRRFVHVSTDEVYGSLGPRGRFRESTPLSPNSPYAASKAGSDLLVHAFHKTHGLATLITRCSNNYGPYQFPEKFIPLMILRALEGKPLPLYGDGLYVRDWIHVEDHCRALLRVHDRGRPGDVYNIGGNSALRNLEVARRILKLAGQPSDLLERVVDRPGHDRRYAIDCGKMDRELDWRPRRAFDRGLEATVRWYEEHETWWQRILAGSYLVSRRRAQTGRRRLA